VTLTPWRRARLLTGNDLMPLRSFSRLLRGEEGAVAVIAGAAIAAAVGLGAFTVDLSNANSVQSRLQNAADAAALAAAQRLSISEAEARALALEFVQMNVSQGDGAVSRPEDVQFGRYDKATKEFQAGATPYDAIKVIARRTAAGGNPVKTYFGGLFGIGSVDVQVEAIAAVQPALYCVFALDSSASGAFTASGGGTVRVPRCGIQVHSTAADAMVAVGNSSIAATAHCIAGGAGGYSGGNISPTPESTCDQLPDPLAHLSPPTPPDDCYMTDETITYDLVLPAGKKYCGNITIAGSAQVTLQEGIYYFENADLKVTQQASFEGDKVLLYFDSNSDFHFTATGDLVLTADSKGKFAGIAIFGSRNGSSIRLGKINGNRKVYVGGTIYVPKMNLEMAGDAGLYTEMESGFVITNRYRFTGSAEAIFDIREGALPSGLGTTAALIR
jgi:hypothetical protein